MSEEPPSNDVLRANLRERGLDAGGGKTVEPTIPDMMALAAAEMLEEIAKSSGGSVSVVINIPRRDQHGKEAVVPAIILGVTPTCCWNCAKKLIDQLRSMADTIEGAAQEKFGKSPL